MGIADYLFRHPSENKSNNHKIKAEEMWKNCFTVNDITNCKTCVLEKQAARNQPIAEGVKADNEANARE